MMNLNLNIDSLEKAIDKRHHAMERFYDVDLAKVDREKNLEMLERIKNGMASREDEEAATSLLIEL